MDGKTALYSLRQLLEEDASSGFIDDLTSYQFLNEAGVDLQQRTKYLKGEDEITTVASTASYDLVADYMGLYLKNRSKKYFIKYNDGDTNSYITWIPYESLLLGDNSSNEASVPGRFSVKDKSSLASQVTGTASSAGASTGGKSPLTDAAADFSDVEAGDWVHNTTDGSHGIVILKTSTTVLQTALFNGTDDDWSSADAYVIQPQGRLEIVFDPPCSTAAHTATVYYLQRPAPVYSDYDVFRFPREFTPALVKYAAWLYKYRDREPNYGDKWYLYYDNQARKMADQANHMLRRKNFSVNLKAR
jgi:hypothetical protein